MSWNVRHRGRSGPQGPGETAGRGGADVDGGRDGRAGARGATCPAPPGGRVRERRVCQGAGASRAAADYSCVSWLIVLCSFVQRSGLAK